MELNCWTSNSYLLTGSVTLYKLAALTVPQFSHMQNNQISSSYFKDFLWWRNESFHVKFCGQCLAYSEYSISNIHYYYHNKCFEETLRMEKWQMKECKNEHYSRVICGMQANVIVVCSSSTPFYMLLFQHCLLSFVCLYDLYLLVPRLGCTLPRKLNGSLLLLELATPFSMLLLFFITMYYIRMYEKV